MMLYPPQINGTLPAFCKNDEGIDVLSVPFTMNKTVSTDSVWGFAVRIKTIQSNQLIYTDIVQANLDSTKEAVFELKKKNFIVKNSLNIGQFYKVQIAYVFKDNEKNNKQGEVGYFSTIGVVKYTSKPVLTIANMEANSLHSDLGTYEGVYYNKDITEKLYSYCFDVYDSKNNLIITSGTKLHNHETDTKIDETVDEFILTTSLESNKFYKIVYSGVTTNGMKVSSPYYRIVQQSSIAPEIHADIIATMNQENGYVQIRVQGHIDEANGLEKNAIGTFQILRSSELGGYNDWQVIKRFALFGSPPSKLDIKDFTIEQGKSYKYALQQYNNDTNLFSDKIYSEIVISDFEDMFLYDGKRQLKIKYNPKISSFKQNLQETKTITLGQKYPFILRNGKVNYKEFPISGLVSYHMDEEQLFMQESELGLDGLPFSLERNSTLRTGITSADTEYFEYLTEEHGLNFSDEMYNAYIAREVVGSNENLIANHKKRTTNLINYNIAAERLFKLKVLEFLNDGQPKLFRSPGEGNYIVRLMNSSLAPNDQLGRMLHTFSTTATEIEEFSPAALEKLDIISTKEIDTRQQRWETILLSDLAEKSDDEGWIKINRYTVNSMQCLDMVPGTNIRITYKDFSQINITIGMTGAYYVEFEKEVDKIEVDKQIFKVSLQGQITYGFYGTTFNHFDTYKEITINDIPLMQLIGEQRNDNGELIDVKTKLTDIKNIITEFTLLHFVKREVVPVYKYNNNFYFAPTYISNDLADEASLNQTAINLKSYNNYVGKESIFWAPELPDKRYGWETIYSYHTASKEPKGVINIRAVLSDRSAAGLEICYQTNRQLIEFKEMLQAQNYKYAGAYQIIQDTDKDFIEKLNSYLTIHKPNDVILVNGVTAYICKLNAKNVKEWQQYTLTKLGNIVNLDSTNNTWFRLEQDDEYITEIKLRLQKTNKIREGYVVYETYFDFYDIEKDLEPVKEYDKLCIYKVINNANFEKAGFSEKLYIDGFNGQYTTYSNIIKLDNSQIDISNTEEYFVTIPNTVNTVYIPSGVLADIGAQRRTIVYGIESKEEYNTLLQLKAEWEETTKNLHERLYNSKFSNDYDSKLIDCRMAEKEAYEKYIEQLTKELRLLSGEEGNE